MSRDNTVNIKAGGNVSVEALAVGDAAQAASIRSSGAAQELAEHFLQIRSTFDELEAKGELAPAEARLLKEESAEVEKAAQAVLEDKTGKEKEGLGVKLKRFAGSVQTFCHANNKFGVFSCLSAIAALCGVPEALTGLPFMKIIV
jgi:hypothetical protein